MDRVSYLLQEIYGIENKNNQETKVSVQISPFLHESQCCKGSLKLYQFEFWLDLLSLSSHQMMRTATTVTSVLSVCLTCEIHSSCPADICVSATPAQTLCVTRPTTVQSAGCVRTAILIKFCSLMCFANAIWRRVKVKHNELLMCLIWACVPLTSLQSLAADQSREEKAWCSFPRVFQPCSGSDYGPWRALSKSQAHLCIIR